MPNERESTTTNRVLVRCWMIQTPVTASNENDSIFCTFFLQTYYLFAHVFTTVYAVRAVHDDESGCYLEDQIIIEMRTKKNGCRSTSACGQPKNPNENWQLRALLTKIRLSSMRSQTFHVYFFQSPFHIGEIIDKKSLESWDWIPPESQTSQTWYYHYISENKCSLYLQPVDTLNHFENVNKSCVTIKAEKEYDKNETNYTWFVIRSMLFRCIGSVISIKSNASGEWTENLIRSDYFNSRSWRLTSDGDKHIATTTKTTREVKQKKMISWWWNGFTWI